MKRRRLKIGWNIIFIAISFVISVTVFLAIIGGATTSPWGILGLATLGLSSFMICENLMDELVINHGRKIKRFFKRL